MSWFRRSLVLGGGLGVITSAVVSGGTAAVASPGWTVSPVITGLQEPRGVAFDGLGGMYVAETGLPASGPFGVTNTGAVDKYVSDGSAWQRSWSTGFVSIFDRSHGEAEALGPEGLSVVGSGCTRSSMGVRNGCQVLMIMGASQQGVVAGGGPALPEIGHLYRLDSATGAKTDRGDIGDQEYTWAGQHANLWEEFPDSNPYGVLVTRAGVAASHTFVIDAGANTVSEVDKDGTIHVIAYIPNETPTPGLPTRDATPTCAAEGPDGALYIGTLDLFRNFSPGQGQSHVYRVDPSAHENYLTAAHLWASGLTTVTACTFDNAGNFWATEMFKFGAGGPPGDVVRIPFSDPSQIEHVGGGQLPLPGGIAQGPDGGMYVTVFATGTSVANGAVVRLSQQ